MNGNKKVYWCNERNFGVNESLNLWSQAVSNQSFCSGENPKPVVKFVQKRSCNHRTAGSFFFNDKIFSNYHQ